MLLGAAIGAVWRRKLYPQHIATAHKDSSRWMQQLEEASRLPYTFASSRASRMLPFRAWLERDLQFRAHPFREQDGPEHY